MDDNERLTEIFGKVGKGYGYDTVNAQYMQYRDFKIRWQRSYRWADFRVSDYMRDASEEVTESLADTLFGKIVSGGEAKYGQLMKDFVSSPDFVRRNQPVYLRRSRNLTRSPLGEHRDLGEAYLRLVDEGLLDHDPQVCLSWTKEPIPTGRAARCSVLMKVVGVSNALDDPKVPEDALDFALYTELCRISIGFDPSGELNVLRMPKLMDKYGDKRRKDAAEGLRRHQLFV